MQSLNLIILRGVVTEKHLISRRSGRGQPMLSFRLATCERWGRGGYLHYEYHQLLLRDSGSFRKYSMFGRHIKEGALLLVEGVLRHQNAGGRGTFIDCHSIVPQARAQHTPPPSVAEADNVLQGTLSGRDMPILQQLAARLQPGQPGLINTLYAAGLSAAEIRVLYLLLHTCQLQIQSPGSALAEERSANDGSERPDSGESSAA